MKKQIKDITGHQFGFWTVIRFHYKDSHYRRFWWCRCACGVEKAIYESSLICGDSTSCGCKPRLFQDLTGKKYGKWTVVKRVDNQAGNQRWLCQCECGTERTVAAGTLKNGDSTSCGCSFRAEDLSRRRFGKWTVIQLARDNKTTKYWLARCACGTEKEVSAVSLLSGKSRSCGCGREEFRRETIKPLLMTGTKTYKTWSGIIQRCTNKNNSRYTDYGGNGIAVCERWLTFKNFYKDMGDPPSDTHQIDRIDNNGNYEPGNCRWVTPKVNARNKRKTKRILFMGENLSTGDWSERTGISQQTLIHRIRRGWSPERILLTPVRSKKHAQQKKENVDQLEKR